MTRTTISADLEEALVVAVANTGHEGHDELSDLGSLRAWWREISGERLAGGEAEVDLLRAARTIIRVLALRNNGVDVEVDPAALATVGALALRFTVTDGPDLVVGDASSTQVRDLAARTLAALMRCSADIGWARIKACPGPDCGWVFHDRSRNASRRWCDMGECGNRAKGAAFRARRRTAS